MEEIKVGNVYCLNGGEKKFYTVSNIECHLSTDIQEDSKKTITLSDNESDHEIIVPSNVFWHVFKNVETPKAGDRVHVKLLDFEKVDFYATLKEEHSLSYKTRCFRLSNCTKEEYGDYVILKPHIEGYGLGKEDFYTVTKEETAGKVVYMAGHILNQAMVEYREKQHNEVEGIKGVKPYSPHQDKSINDKSNAEQTELAERILNNDFKAMKESDVFVFDVLNEGLGTIAELGIVLGMKHRAEKLLLSYENSRYKTTSEDIYDEIKEARRIVNKPVFCYCSDIRQGHGKPYNDPDRAEFSTNQFVYGMVLALTNGEGFISWEEVKERLKNI